MKFLHSKEAIKKILDGGGFPEPDLPRRFFSRNILEEFYSLSILELWEYLSELDFIPEAPPGIDTNLLYKKPFGEDTEYILQKCIGFEGLPILNSDLYKFAVQKHLSFITTKRNNYIPCSHCEHLYQFKESVFEELTKCIGVFEYKLNEEKAKGYKVVKEIDDEIQERTESLQKILGRLSDFQGVSPTQKAAQAKTEKSLAAWKEVFPAMMKVYARCMEEGEKPRQGPDFYAMFNELDAVLTDTQMRFFRSCLPEGHSDTDGGKCGKA